MKFFYAVLGMAICGYQINDMWGNNWAWLFIGSLIILDSWWQTIEGYFK